MDASGMVYQNILEAYLSGTPTGSANAVARELGISPNTANIAIRALESIGAVMINPRSFEITNFNKAFMYWAASRKLHKDIVYSTFTGKGVKYIEDNMPGAVAFTAFTGYSLLYGNDVSDYAEVYVYATDDIMADIKHRFPKNILSNAKSDYADLVVLKPDAVLEREMLDGKLPSPVVKPTQICTDLWNIRGWAASRFFDRLYARLTAVVPATAKI